MPKDKNEPLTDAQRTALKAAELSVKEIEQKAPSWSKFPGPRGVDVPLRASFSKDAYAAVVSHAKVSLDKEICGVLAGKVCEDEDGSFILVEAAIRGAAAKQANTHVTFTQETWNIIHKTMDSDYPKLSIVGWYHSHPGFGVEFSDMDLFIQKNFFRSPTQVGMVTDPLGGDVAMIVETASGIEYINRFWVDGREHRCKVPAREMESSSSGDGGGTVSTGAIEKRIESLETRMGQLIQASDDLRAWFYRIILFVAMTIAFMVVLWIGWNIYSSWAHRYEPPKSLGDPLPVMVPVPGGKAVLVFLDVKGWQIPPEVQEAWLKEFKKRADELEKQNATTQPASQPSK